MRIDLLGTLAVHGSARDGPDPAAAGAAVSVVGSALGGRRAHLALASLALTKDVVSPDLLADHVWGDDPPPTWQVALRGLIRALRTALQPIAEDSLAIIVTAPRGYRIGADVTTDIDRAGADLARAIDMIAAGRPRPAREIAAPISRLNGSQLLVGEDAAWIVPHRQLVDAIALTAMEIVVDASSALGDHHAAISAGRRAVAGNPLEERSLRSLIRALHAAGDRAGAVQVFEAGRAALADELGIDPSSATIQVYLLALGDQGAPSSARLPTATTSFHARVDDLAALAQELHSAGLVVLSGRGGVGKSRLALEAARAATHFAGGRFWVNLAALGEDDLVASAVAITLGVSVGTQDPADAIAAELAPLGQAMLILDGCEQVVDGAGSLAAALIANCPALTVLATSRIPLAVEGARLQTITPLPIPGSDIVDLAQSPMVALLRSRMRDSGANFALDAELAPFLRDLLKRCAGLPLAVELVARQLASSSIADLLDELADAPRSEPDALRSIARSSYTSLADDEAAVFRRFAVLDGEMTLPLLRQVVSGGAIPALRVVRVLRELTARGLIGVTSDGARWRYHQDDDLRRFAGELLVECGEERDAFDRLADAIRSLLPDDPRDPPDTFHDAVTGALATVRSFLRAGLEGRASRDRCLEIAFRLHRYWAASNVGEGRFWLSRLLASEQRSPWTPYATYALGYLDYWSGATDQAVPELQDVVALFEGVDDPYKARSLIYLAGMLDDVDRGAEAVDCVRSSMIAAAPFGPDLRVSAAMGMGSVLSERGLAEAATHAAAAITLCREHGSQEQLAAAMPTAAMITWQVGVLNTAREYIAEALPMHRQARRIARVVLLSAAAGVALADGDVAGSIDYAEQADLEGTSLGVEREMPLIRSILARAHLAAGEIPAAATAATGALQAALVLEFTFPLATCLETAALVIAAGRRDHRIDADQLLATAEQIRTAGDRPAPVTLRSSVDELRSTLRVEMSTGDRATLGAVSGFPEPPGAVPLLPPDAALLALHLLGGPPR